MRNRLACGCAPKIPISELALTPDFLKLRFDSMRIPLEFFNHDEMKLFKIHGGNYQKVLKQKGMIETSKSSP